MRGFRRCRKPVYFAVARLRARKIARSLPNGWILNPTTWKHIYLLGIDFGIYKKFFSIRSQREMTDASIMNTKLAPRNAYKTNIIKTTPPSMGVQNQHLTRVNDTITGNHCGKWKHQRPTYPKNTI